MSWSRRTLAYCNLVSPQVFTGVIPFNNSLPAAAMLAIMGGERPPRPTHPTLTDQLWRLIQRCWDQKPHLRPEVSGTLQVIFTSLVPHLVTIYL